MTLPSPLSFASPFKKPRLCFCVAWDKHSVYLCTYIYIYINQTLVSDTMIPLLRILMTPKSIFEHIYIILN